MEERQRDEQIYYNYNFSKSYESSIWKGFLIILSMVFLWGVYNCGKEIYYYEKGECVVGELYRDDSVTATIVYNEKRNAVLVSRTQNKVVDNKVNVYIINENIYSAMAMTRPIIWVRDFAIMLVLYFVIGLKIYKIYHREEEVERVPEDY